MGGGGGGGGGSEKVGFGFLWSLLDAPNVCVPIKFSTCSHHVPNAFFSKKLVPQFPIVFLQKMFPRGTKILTKISHCFCPNLGKVNRSYFLCHKDHPILLLVVVVVVVVLVLFLLILILILVLYLAMIGK
jgi:hypothetical protein